MGLSIVSRPYKKVIGINDFSFQFRKIITRYRRIGYNLNVMRQSACLVLNPIMVDNYAASFNCTPVRRASDSMMAPTCLLLGQPASSWCFSFAPELGYSAPRDLHRRAAYSIYESWFN